MRRWCLSFPAILGALGAGCGSDPATNEPGNSNEYKLGGTVSGLEGTNFALEAALDNVLNTRIGIVENGSFTFVPTLADGSTYNVTVARQPSDPAQDCKVTGGSGKIAGSDVTSIAVECETRPLPGRSVGGDVLGLNGAGLVLQNNAGDDLSIAADGAFQFATKQNDGQTYDVTVLTQPTNPAQTCSVSNGKGTLDGADITNIAVKCVDDPLPNPKHPVGGTLVGSKAWGSC